MRAMDHGRAALCCGILSVVAAAQGRPAGHLRVMAGQQLVDCDSRTVVGGLGLSGYWPRAAQLGPGVYTIGSAAVDADAGQVLFVKGDRVELANVAGRVTGVWQSTAAMAHVAPSADDGQRWLGKDRAVLVKKGGGLVALDRANGDVVWERDAVPSSFVLVDGDLVIAAGPVDGKPHLVAMALQNGARAFDVPLRASPTGLAAAPHGIAVLTEDGFVVHDRAGPEIFTAKERPQAIVGGPDAWFTATYDRTTARNRVGEVKWTAAPAVGDFESVALAALPDGGVVHVKFMRHADSGFEAECFAAASGHSEWRHVEPGLGVDHSKYWHEVQARAVPDRLLLTSQAAGGAFVVELDPATGDRRERAQFPIR